MSSIKPDIHPIFPIHPSSEPQRHHTSILWDVVLLVAITCALGFVAIRVQASALTPSTGGISLERLAAVSTTQAPQSTETATVPQLIAALKDPDPNTRMRAAQALGWQRAAEASNALLAATFDPDAHVQEEATVALGEIGDLQALPRLEQLEATQNNLSIQLAAYAAEAQLTEHIAANLKLPRSVVQALDMAQNGAGFAAASDELFRLNQDGSWQDLGPLPDSPTQLSAAPDGQLVYMGTVASGLFRSVDGGHTWSPVSLGNNVSARVTATAVVINPHNTRQIYVALAEIGPDGSATNPHGVIVSQDEGKTWKLLADSPSGAVTRRLVLDPATPNSLYGVTDEGPFRYDLGPSSSSYHTD